MQLKAAGLFNLLTGNMRTGTETVSPCITYDFLEIIHLARTQSFPKN